MGSVRVNAGCFLVVIGVLSSIVTAAEPTAVTTVCRERVQSFAQIGFQATCEQVNADDIDIGVGMEKEKSCSLGDAVDARIYFDDIDHINPRIELHHGDLVESVPTPRQSFLKTNFIGVPAPFGCSSTRVFWAHPVLGYVSAFGPSGKLLWQHDLPGFKSIDTQRERLEGNIPAIMEGFQAKFSLASRVIVVGEVLCVEHRDPGNGWVHTFFHSSGIELGEIGPWDSLLLSGDEHGWTFATGGGTDIRFYSASARLRVTVRPTAIEAPIRHFIAWMQPRPTDAKFAVGCASRAVDEPRYWLGKDYDEKTAAQTRDVLYALLAREEWLSEISSRPATARAIKRYSPRDPEWRKEYANALVSDGTDVDFAAAWQKMYPSTLKKVGGANSAGGVPPLNEPPRQSESGSTAGISKGKLLGLEDLVGNELEVSLTVAGLTLGDALQTIGNVAGFHVRYEVTHQPTATIAPFVKLRVGEVLDRLAKEYRLQFEVPNPTLLVVRSVSPVK